MKRFLVPFRMHDTGWLVIAFCVLFGIGLYGLRLGLAVGAAIAASLLLHEMGHMLAAILLRVPVREFGLCLLGAYNRRARAASRRDEVLISGAGSLINLFFALPLLYIPVVGTQLALCNLLLCVGNLLPLPSSDGLRILRIMWPSRPSAPDQPAPLSIPHPSQTRPIPLIPNKI
jgi:Zn-dependent protease